MKVIPTRYAGCHFRSRLEARWAVFFDRLGVAWQYEPEGFDLGGAGWFLPDFRVGTLDQRSVWVETKPLGDRVADPDDVLTRKELLKMRTFAVQPGVDLVVVGEFPAPDRQLNTWRYTGSIWHVSAEGFGADRPTYCRAWEAARSARFEFGFSGTS